jgi:hypothetical protein
MVFGAILSVIITVLVAFAAALLYVYLRDYLIYKLISDKEEAKINKLLKAITAHVATSLPTKSLQIVTQRVKQPGRAKAEWIAALRVDPGVADSILTRTFPCASKSAALHMLELGFRREIKERDDQRRKLEAKSKMIEKMDKMRKSGWKVERVREDVEERGEDVVWIEEE